MKEITLQEMKNILEQLKISLDIVKNTGGYNEFDKWRADRKEFKKGLSRASVQYNAKNDIERTVNRNIKSEDDFLVPVNLELRNRIFTAERFVEAIENYQVFKVKFQRPDQLYYKAYFFYHLEETEEPELGMSLISIQQTKAYLHNVKDDISSDYEGDIEHLQDNGLFFDMSSVTKKISIHIKVNCSNLSNDNIMLGAYISFEDNHITQGSILLEATDKLEEPKIYSLFRNKEELENNVNPNILSYLALKKYNFAKVKRNVVNETRLERFVQQDFKENFKTRFIDYAVPKMFMAVPTEVLLNQNTKSVIHQIIEGVQNENNNIDVRINDGTDEKLRAIEKPPSFVQLQRCRFFVLFCFKGAQYSLSTVQLGWAMAYCKRVIVFYEEGGLSANFLKLRGLGVLMEKFSDLSKDMNHIISVLNVEISVNLGYYKNLF